VPDRLGISLDEILVFLFGESFTGHGIMYSETAQIAEETDELTSILRNATM
jgi:hypothetical protein